MAGHFLNKQKQMLIMKFIKMSLFCFSSSVVYMMDSNNRFTIHQQIPTVGASSLATFTEKGQYYLVIGNQRDTTGVYEQKTIVYQWEEATSLFTPVQELNTVDCQNVHVFYDGNGHGV